MFRSTCEIDCEEAIFVKRTDDLKPGYKHFNQCLKDNETFDSVT